MMAKYSIQYRQMKTDNMPNGVILKNAIIDFLRSDIGDGQIGYSAKRRIEDLDQDRSVVILNKITEPEHWDDPIFGGQLIQLQPDANVPAILQSLEEDADEFLLEQVNLGDDGRAVKGVLYFAVVGNHLGILEDQGVKGKTLERYLTSAFQRTNAIEFGQAIILNGEFTAADGKQLDSASSISINAEPSSDTEPNRVNELMGREVDRQQREGATVFDVLRTLGWNDEAINRLNDEVPQDGWVEGLFSFAIKFKKRKQAITRATINEALRNIDPSDLGLSGDGSEKNGIVKLSSKRSIQLIAGMKDPEDAILKIIEALREWAELGKIDCDFE